MRWAAGALALLLAGSVAGTEPDDEAAAYAARHPELAHTFSAAWRRLLRSLPELRDHYRFVQAQPRVDLRFPAPGKGFGETTIAVYEQGLVKVNRRWLAGSAAALEAKGVPYDRIPDILAWKFLPVLVHELRHGMTVQEERAELGRACEAFIVEDEMLAFRDEVAALKPLLAQHPLAFHHDLFVSIDEEFAKILASWDAGPGTFVTDVTATYPTKLSALDTPREQLLETSLALRSRHDAQLAAWRSKDAKAREALTADYGPEAAARLEELARHDADCVAVASNAELWGRWRRFFEERVQAFGEDWAAERQAR